MKSTPGEKSSATSVFQMNLYPSHKLLRRWVCYTSLMRYGLLNYHDRKSEMLPPSNNTAGRGGGGCTISVGR